MKAKPHGVCFHCRVTFKNVMRCPHCRQPMINMGFKFKAPRRNNIRVWKKIHLRCKPYIEAHPEYVKIKFPRKPELEYWE